MIKKKNKKGDINITFNIKFFFNLEIVKKKRAKYDLFFKNRYIVLQL